jgi:hypothetical protein
MAIDVFSNGIINENINDNINDNINNNMNDIIVDMWSVGKINALLSYKSKKSGNNEDNEKDADEPVLDLEIYMDRETYLKRQNEFFSELCKKSDLDTIRMHILTHKEIDLHYDSERPFLNACVNNSTDVVEYMYKYVKPDISVNNDEIFRFTCHANNIDNVMYLMKICDRFDVKMRVRKDTDNADDPIGIWKNYVVDVDSMKISSDKYHYMYD